jgi:hypothetical protein
MTGQARLFAGANPASAKIVRVRHLSKAESDRVREQLEALLATPEYSARGGKSLLQKRLGISQPAYWRILNGGGVSLETARAVAALSGNSEAVHESMPTKFSRLEAVIELFPHRWPPSVVAAARVGAFVSDCPAPEWVRRLDRLERAIKSAAATE